MKIFWTNTLRRALFIVATLSALLTYGTATAVDLKEPINAGETAQKAVSKSILKASAKADTKVGSKAGHKVASKKGYSKTGDYKSKKEDIMLEISFLAKKLLDMSDEDEIVVKSPAVLKPFMGVCSMVNDNGIKLTCITPASQAEKFGLKTGDIITAINGLSMAVPEQTHTDKHPYWKVVKSMEIGSLLKMNVLRDGQQQKINLIVGSLTHPAYELKVSR